jgi:hypothetical protein
MPLAMFNSFLRGQRHDFRKDYAVAKQGGRVKITLARESAAFTY